ncbi:MAG: M50 family metallopeptidase [Candidatus Sungbacteria bacterium]|nr:M50 family metallopeptidase [bacterium]MDZ4286151.1 M50 family metallopeptidase [Candidatus Sungbacteria bacterium]
MITLVMLVVSLSLLIIVHELGHFYSARFLKVKVEEFGFGFPPKVYSRVKNGIRYSINLLPLGGFVKIFGEHGEGENSHESFSSRPAWQRMIILGAGVGMNIVLAWVFFSVGAAVGTPQVSDDAHSGLPISIIGILPRSPAEQRGLRFGDQIIELRSGEMSLRVESEKDVSDFVDGYRGEEITMIIRRAGNAQEIKVTPRVRMPEGEGPLGISMGRLSSVRVAWYKAPFVGAQVVAETLVAIVSGLGVIIREFFWYRHTDVAVSGPVGIYFFGRDIQALGFSYILQFVGMLSVNLAVLNALPIPALDGGRMFFILIEKLRGSRVNPRLENMAHSIGFAVLILLMVLVTYKDLLTVLS